MPLGQAKGVTGLLTLSGCFVATLVALIIIAEAQEAPVVDLPLSPKCLSG